MRIAATIVAASTAFFAAPARAAPHDAHHLSVIFDTSSSLSDARPAVIETVRTLAWSLVLASDAAGAQDVTMSLMAFTDKALPVAAVQHGRFDFRFDVGGWTSAAGRMGWGNGAVEDGYLGIYTALEAHPPELKGHILFVSDEDRDVGSPHTYGGLLAALHKRDLALDAFVAVQLACGDGRRALGMTHKGVGYVLDDRGNYTICTDAAPKKGFGTTVGDYLSLAFATGGSVWDITTVSDGRGKHWQPQLINAIAQGYTSVVVNRARWEGRSGQLLAKPVIEPALAMIGDVIMLDGQRSRAVDPENAIAEWRWEVTGDGTPDLYGPQAAYVFDRAGLHPIQLIVTGTGDARDSRTVWIEVRDPNDPPERR